MRLFSFIVFVLISGIFAQEVSIRFTSEFEGPLGPVQLRDIAEIKAPQHLKKELGQLHISYMPQPGRSKRVYTNTFLRFKINPIYPTDQIELSGAPVIRLFNPGQILDATEQKHLIQEYVSSKLDYDSDSTEILIRSKLKPLYLPQGSYDLKWNISPGFDSRGQENIIMEVYKSGKKVAKYHFHINILQWRKIVQASRRLKAGQLIKKDDVTHHLQEVTHNSRDFIYSLEDAIGQEVNRTIVSGRVLHYRELHSPTLVKAGEPVKLKVKLATGFLEVAGTARESGSHGEVIRVFNQSSHAALKGKVIGEGIIEVLN